MAYGGDSFFTLGGAERVGLLVLSVVLSVGILLIAWRLMRARSFAVRLGIATLLFGLFVWLSPQIYYAYYQLIFDGLPVQWVIGWPPFSDILKTARFAGPSNLSAHGQGALFWVLIILALAARGLRKLMSSTTSPQKQRR
jgi:hypothetical protein